jgi:hypothetical protein
MGKVNLSGIVHGKLGKYVTYSRYGDNIIKLYKKPKDSKTPSQLKVRNVFRNVSHIASMLSRTVLKPYTLPKPEKCSAYVFMIGRNKLMFSNNEWNPADLKIFEGPLENPGINSAVLTGDIVTVTFDTAGGKDNDVAIAVVYDEITGGVYKTIGTRSSGEITVFLMHKAKQDAANFHAYLVFSRVPPITSLSKGLVSATAYKKVV